MEFSKLPTIPPILTVILIFVHLPETSGYSSLCYVLTIQEFTVQNNTTYKIGAIMYSDCEN